MSVKPISVNINSKQHLSDKNKQQNIPVLNTSVNYNYLNNHQSNVNFTGFAPKSFMQDAIINTMNFIAAGGFAVSFCLQDGVGFIAPRVGKGLLRNGPIKKDKDGNTIYNKKGEPERGLNWAYAKKEALREVITGPSAFIIPAILLTGIKKHFGSANNVKMNYIDSHTNSLTDYLVNHGEDVKNGTAKKVDLYKSAFKDMLEKTFEKHSNEFNIDEVAEKFAEDQITFEENKAKIQKLQGNMVKKYFLDSSTKKEIQKLKEGTPDIVKKFMELKKQHLDADVNELVLSMSSSEKGKTNSGSISEFLKSLPDYFDDALQTTKKKLQSETTTDIKELGESIAKKFRTNRLTSRLLTNLGLFSIVGIFYTQIPKLYNMGLKSNPAIANNEDTTANKSAKKNVNFTGLSQVGDKVFKNKGIWRKISDLYELNGPIITGGAMSTLLYGICIPTRVRDSLDEYDLGENLLRDPIAFTALLYGANALSRLSSDILTKLTGLALNSRKLEGRKFAQKVLDYLRPGSEHHSILSNEQLESKYTNIDKYKDKITGFMNFIENSHGDLTKVFNHDEKIKETVNNILAKSSKSLKTATAEEIRDILSKADNTDLDKLYDLFKDKNNGILKAAKTCNSAFGFISSFVIIPIFIMELTDLCTKMTENRIKKANSNKTKEHEAQVLTSTNRKSMNPPTMEGFIKSAQQ